MNYNRQGENKRKCIIINFNTFQKKKEESVSHTGECEVVARRAGKISKLENEQIRK